jgi:hypothetical protein
MLKLPSNMLSLCIAFGLCKIKTEDNSGSSLYTRVDFKAHNVARLLASSLAILTESEASCGLKERGI